MVQENFECVINAEPWKPQAPLENYITGMFGANTQVALKCRYDEYNGNNGITITANRYRKQDTTYLHSSLDFSMPNVAPGVTYSFTNISGPLSGKPIVHFYTESNCFYSNYDQGNIVTGTLNVTEFSKTERKISGTFLFQLQNPCGVINISQGKFSSSF